MNDNNEKKIKIYVALLITVICVIGISYAWFRLYLSQSENNKITARTCFDVSFTENTDKISLVDAVPEDDSDGLREKPFTFTLKNNCEGYVKAYITIDSAYRTSTSSSYLKDNQVKVNVSPKGTVVSNGMLLTAGELMEIDNNSKGYVINVTGLESNEEKSFDLRLWMDGAVTQSDGLNKTWEGSVVVSAVAETKLPPWDNPEDGTLLAAIKRDNIVTTPTTTPGSDTSSSTEAVLASTEDDYGTSYYFRGAVTNNFVEYANMCWRIVRVTGDGSIKLVLYNYNGLTSTNNTPSSSTPCNVTGNNYAFARYNGNTYTSAFNVNRNDNAYVGLMYGATGATSYAAAQANTNPSTILTNLNKWYTNVLSKQANFKDSQLADTIWCNDKRVVTETAFNPSSLNLGTNYGYAKNANYYGATKRLVSSSGNAGGTGPSLICPNDNNAGKLSKFTVSDTEYGNGALNGYAKVGLLTADEISFAGAGGTPNSTYYIKGNTNSSYWWALSPAGFFDGEIFVWYADNDDDTLGVISNDGDTGVRPSLSLVANIKISSGTGTGTATNPYKITS